jgi:hypothetical protein
MIRRLVLCSSAVLALAACGAEPPAEPAPAPVPPPADPAAPTTPAPAPAGDVITAEGFGPLRIGMTRAEVVAALGEDSQPGGTGGPEPEQCDEFHPVNAPDGLLVMLEKGVLTRVSITRNTAIKSDRGFGVGDTAEAVKAAYGPRAVASPHKYQDPPAEYITAWSTGGGTGYVQDPAARGVVYEVSQNGRVSAVRGGGPSIQYVEGCL